MVTLSGGVAQNANISPMEAFLQQYGGNIAAASQGLPTFNLGLSYSAPIAQPPIQAPVLPVQTSSPTPENINVDYSPVQQSSSNLQLAPIQFPDMPAFNPTGPATIQVGGRQYPADSVIAQAIPSFAPGRKVDLGDTMMPVYNGANFVGYRKVPSQQFTPGVPQMDTMSDDAYGYQGTQVPQAPMGGQPMNLNSGIEALPDNLLGMPNPYMQRPAAPNYYQSAPAQQIMNMPQQALDNLPQRADYMLSAQRYVPPSNPIARALWAMPGNARARAGMVQAAEDRYNRDLQAAVAIRQTTLPSQISAMKEMMQQQGADYRLAASAYNQGSQTLLNFLLDQEEKRQLSTAQALDLAANAFLLPSMVPTQFGMEPNRQKVAMLRQAGRFLNWSEADVYGLMQQQDPNAAENLKQQKLKTEKGAFDLKKAKEMLNYEFQQLSANIDQTRAQTGLISAQARTANFDVGQREQVAKYARWGMIADSMQKVGSMLLERGTRDARTEAANLANKKEMAEIYKKQLEAQSIPLEAAAKLASSMASLSSSMDPQAMQIGHGMVDQLYQLLGINQKPVLDTNGQVSFKPIAPSGPARGFRQSMPQAPQMPQQYFSGGPLSGGMQPTGYMNQTGD